MGSIISKHEKRSSARGCIFKYLCRSLFIFPLQIDHHIAKSIPVTLVKPHALGGFREVDPQIPGKPAALISFFSAAEEEVVSNANM